MLSVSCSLTPDLLNISCAISLVGSHKCLCQSGTEQVIVSMPVSVDICLTSFESTWYCYKDIFIVQLFLFLKNESNSAGNTLLNLCQTVANHGCYWNVLYHNIKFNLDNLKKRHLGNLLHSSFTKIMWPHLYQTFFVYSFETKVLLLLCLFSLWFVCFSPILRIFLFSYIV